MHLQQPFHFLLLFLLPLLNHNIRHVCVWITLSLNCVKRVHYFGGIHESVDAEAVFQPLLQQIHLTARLLSQQVQRFGSLFPEPSRWVLDCLLEASFGLVTPLLLVRCAHAAHAANIRLHNLHHAPLLASSRRLHHDLVV